MAVVSSGHARHAADAPAPGVRRILLASEPKADAARAWAAALARAHDAEMVALPLDAEADAGRALTRVARAADLVVLDAGGPFGGVDGERLRDRLPASVLLARGARPPCDVLAGVDGSEPSRAAAQAALALGARWRRHVSVMHVRPAYAYPRRVFDGLDAGGARVSFGMMVGDPVTGVPAAARLCGAGLLVVGASGDATGWRFPCGSVAAAAWRDAHCSVLVVRRAL